MKATKSSTLAKVMVAPPTSPRPAKGWVRWDRSAWDRFAWGRCSGGPDRHGGLLASPCRWDYRTADQWGRRWRMAAARHRHETPGADGQHAKQGQAKGPGGLIRSFSQALTRGAQQIRDRDHLTRLAKIQISHLFRHPPRHPRPETSFTLATRHPLVGAAPAPTGKDPSVRGQKAAPDPPAPCGRSVPSPVAGVC